VSWTLSHLYNQEFSNGPQISALKWGGQDLDLPSAARPSASTSWQGWLTGQAGLIDQSLREAR
jgi:hypothetical protein